MITPDDLKDELGSLGMGVSLRTLTDWWQKGLLPPLKKEGLGRGKGTKNYWPNEEVITQAYVIQHLLDTYANTDAALMKLWTGGYAVSNERAKKIWIKDLEKRKHINRKQIDKIKTALPEDEFPSLIGKWINRIKRKGYVPKEKFDEDPALEDFFIQQTAVFYDPNFTFESEHISSLVIDLFKMDNTTGNFHKVEEVIELIKPALLAVLPINARLNLIESSTEEELRDTNQFLKDIGKIIFYFLRGLHPEKFIIEIRFIAFLFLTSFGHLIAICFIQLKRNGLDENFVRSVKAIVTYSGSLSTNDIKTASEGKLQLVDVSPKKWISLKSELKEIWDI